MALPLRDETDKKYHWRIEDLYETDKLWEADYEKALCQLKKEPEYKGRLNESEEIMYQALKECDDLEQMLEKLYVYANQKYYEDTGNPVYQNLAGKSQNLMTMFYAKYSYQEPEILEMSEEQLRTLVQSGGKIKLFRHYLENILRQKPHILSAEMENAMANAGDMAQGAKDIFSSFNNADIKFAPIQDSDGKEIEVTHGNYSLLMENRDRTVRKEAFLSVYRAYGDYKNTLASMYNANVKQALFFARMRKFDSAMESSLNSSNIPAAVYDNLIDTVHENLHLLHRYVSLRKKVLGVEELHMYDVYAPLAADCDWKVSFEEAKERVAQGLAPLGEEYIAILREGYGNGWIDVYENQGKRSGAFSWGAYGTHPYVFLNYQENLNNMFTLAHEMGHAIHTYQSNKTQPHVYAGYRIFVAEVASTCNEALLIRHLIEKSTDKKEKLYLINHFLEQFKGTMFRQTMFAEFEKITHRKAFEGQTLTADLLCGIYRELNEKYFGKDMVIDDEIALEWARIPHFYTPFYVYQYATGFAAAVAISGRILDEGEHAVRGYMEFLKSGSSGYPIEILKKAGVDMGSPKAVEDALKVFEELLDEFEKIFCS